MATSRKSAFLIAMLSVFACRVCAHGQVVIDMPAPKRVPTAAAATQSTAQVPSTTGVIAAPLALPPTEGELALNRYAGARSLPRDTYFIADRFAGIRQYGYPYAWWGGFGFPHFHVHGNKFVGFVGRPRCH